MLALRDIIRRSSWRQALFNPKKKETIYTRLRNEFGHPRKNRLLDDTKEDMKLYLPKLTNLLRRDINEKTKKLTR